MPAMASSPVGRQAGRGLLTLANLITGVAPVTADWNDSHIFKPTLALPRPLPRGWSPWP